MNIKQTISFCLAFVIAITFLPNPTFAEGETGAEPPKAADGYYLLDSTDTGFPILSTTGQAAVRL